VTALMAPRPRLRACAVGPVDHMGRAAGCHGGARHAVRCHWAEGLGGSPFLGPPGQRRPFARASSPLSNAGARGRRTQRYRSAPLPAPPYPGSYRLVVGSLLLRYPLFPDDLRDFFFLT